MTQWLKQAAMKLSYPLFLRLYLLKRRLVDDARYRKVRRLTKIPLLHEIDLGAYKKSDTVFILGSGPSINAIPPERWQAIALHDSIGFNFWVCHPFRYSTVTIVVQPGRYMTLRKSSGSPWPYKVETSANDGNP